MIDNVLKSIDLFGFVANGNMNCTLLIVLSS